MWRGVDQITSIIQDHWFSNSIVKSKLNPSHDNYIQFEQDVIWCKEQISNIISENEKLKEKFSIREIANYLYSTLNIGYDWIAFVFYASWFDQFADRYFDLHVASLEDNIDRFNFYCKLNKQFPHDKAMQIFCLEWMLEYYDEEDLETYWFINYNLWLNYSEIWEFVKAHKHLNISLDHIDHMFCDDYHEEPQISTWITYANVLIAMYINWVNNDERGDFYADDFWEIEWDFINEALEVLEDMKIYTTKRQFLALIDFTTWIAHYEKWNEDIASYYIALSSHHKHDQIVRACLFLAWENYEKWFYNKARDYLLLLSENTDWNFEETWKDAELLAYYFYLAKCFDNLNNKWSSYFYYKKFNDKIDKISEEWSVIPFSTENLIDCRKRKIILWFKFWNETSILSNISMTSPLNIA